ncbi:biopolymer transporter ExbD [Thiohalocapsa marina]|uniref:Biopolymer transporter ExbD n=1 Tax=Thiohalocapsa marina TaxID=424902 RepID=A0A5M8FLH9_9GAMM|nr:biopolymer transporter ExbD [Thiohalocapsa marina]KAA6185793.1 biopolymer transporter ExbD [Thiohalocapsa marina]
MNLRQHRPEPADINLTPLIDVVFLLLIFFMVSTTFREDARLRLQLPQAEGEPVAAEELQLLEITIDSNGRYYVDGQPVVQRTLRQAMAGRMPERPLGHTAERMAEPLADALQQVLGERRDLPVLIRADAQTPHQAVMTALDVVGRIGLSQVAFAASRPESGPAQSAELMGPEQRPAQSRDGQPDGPQ